MAAERKLLHLPAEMVREAKEQWPRLRELPEVKALSLRESGRGAVAVLVYLALKNLDRLAPMPATTTNPAKAGA